MGFNFMTNPIYREGPNGEPVDSAQRPLIMQTQEEYIAREQAFTQQVQNEKALALEESRKRVDAEENFQKTLNEKDAEISNLQKQLKSSEMTRAKLKGFNGLRCNRMFLDHNLQYGPGLVLVTVDSNNRASSLQISGTWVKEAVWVQDTSGQKYLVIKFQKPEGEKAIFIPNETFENDRRLLNLLTTAGISMPISLPLSSQAFVWREYITRMCNVIMQEKPLGWSCNGHWDYTLQTCLPWWDCRNAPNIQNVPVEAQMKLFNSISSLWNGEAGVDDKLLVLMPSAAELLPLLVMSGCRKHLYVNLLVENATPRDFLNIFHATGQNKLLELPMNDKELKRNLMKTKEKVLLLQISATSLPMAEKKLLDSNVRIILEMCYGKKMPVFVSNTPLLLNAEEPILIKYTGTYELADFKMIATNVQGYLHKKSREIADWIDIEKIPSILGEWGAAYELFWLAAKVLQGCCREYANIKLCYNYHELLSFFINQKRNADVDGLALRFLDCLQKVVEDQKVVVISPYDTVTDNAVIVTDKEVYFTRETLQNIISEGIAVYNITTVLRVLYGEGYLVADVGRKINFTTRRRCTDQSGKARYDKFVVLSKDKIFHAGEYDYFFN